jgi:hypothetical protein
MLLQNPSSIYTQDNEGKGLTKTGQEPVLFCKTHLAVRTSGVAVLYPRIVSTDVNDVIYHTPRDQPSAPAAAGMMRHGPGL